MKGRWRHRAEAILPALLGSLLIAFLLLPLLSLLFSISPAELWQGLRHPLVWPALRLSLSTTAISLTLVLLLGTPLAWALWMALSGALVYWFYDGRGGYGRDFCFRALFYSGGP